MIVATRMAKKRKAVHASVLAGILLKALTVVELGRLYEYVAQRGELCCGPEAWKYYDGDRWAIEAVASGLLTEFGPPYPEVWHEVMSRLATASGKPRQRLQRLRHPMAHAPLTLYMQLLEHLSQREVRRAVVVAFGQRWRRGK